MSGIRIGVVVNPTAGHGRGGHRGGQLFGHLARRGHSIVDLTSDDLAGASRQARGAVVDGLDALVVVGGDGMTHLGVNLVAETDLPLGIVAAGSGNDVARSLGLPRHDIAEAVRTIEAGLETGGRRIDAVRTSSPDFSAVVWYLGVLVAGLDAHVNAVANTMSWPRGSGRYLRATLRELPRFRPYGYRITLDGETRETPATVVSVCNGRHIGGGMVIAPEADMTDGLLDVVIAGPLGRWAAAGIFPSIYRGAHVRNPAVSVIRTRSVLIEPSDVGPHPPPAHADGELVGQLPLRIEVVPGAVRLLA